MKSVVIGTVLLVMFVSAITFIRLSCGIINDAGNTAYQEFKPSTLLKKYEWFKDAAAQCDQKLATLKAYESRFTSMKQSYGSDSNSRRAWDRTDREQYNVWESEYLGMKASYNDLASEYNSNMAKFNYSFCNAGTLPQGATVPLPREFKPYLVQ